MKKRETYYMIDIETTGTDKDSDDVLEIAIVPIELRGGYWQRALSADYRRALESQNLLGAISFMVERNSISKLAENFHRKVFCSRQPETDFAKKHMTKLYAECNALNPERDDLGSVSEHLRVWLHGKENYLNKDQEPKFFMGWNASNFDLEFLFRKGVMVSSYYVKEGDKEVLKGDAHYRVYEQTGAIEFLMDVTGLDRKALMSLAEAMIPEEVKLKLPEGKEHDALYDCYSQINMMNGLIALGRSGFKLPGMA